MDIHKVSSQSIDAAQLNQSNLITWRIVVFSQQKFADSLLFVQITKYCNTALIVWNQAISHLRCVPV